MPRLTLRTLLAYIDDTLEPAQARSLGRKVAESEEARLLIERIKKATRRRGLKSPVPDGSDDDVSDPNTVAEYLSDNLESDQLKQMESTCLESDVHLAEVAACHQILTLLLTEPVRVPPTANQRMYLLVAAPASDPNRKPGKTIPVGGVSLPALDQADTDDPDAALLLGMSRYTAADSKGGRLRILTAVAAIAAFLVLAVVMALPQSGGEPPLSNRGAVIAQATTGTPEPTPETRPTPEPKTSGTGTTGGPAKAPKDEPGKTPKKEPSKGKKEEAAVIPPKKPGPSEPKVVAPPPEDRKVPPPLPGRAVVGVMEQPNVIILGKTPDPGSPWLRVDPTNPKINAGSVVMALPGYKGEVKLESGVNVQLWGNIPDQIPEPAQMKPMVLQSRVRFHQPPAGFDADLTLDEGRIYVRTGKATGSKVRVRINSALWAVAPETWDIELPNDKALVMMEAHTGFVPGTPYPRDGVGGEPPRTDAVLVVIRGTATVEDPNRFAKFAAVAAGNQIAWNSKADKLAPPAPVNKQEIVPEPDPLIAAEKGEPIQKKLSEAALNLKDRDGVRNLLEARLNYAKTPEFDTARAIATYSYAAILDGVDPEEAKVMAANLYDTLADSERIVVRQAAVTAVGAWMARTPSNTALFVNMLINAKMIPPEDANLMANLLRGYSAAKFGPAAGDTSKIDDLISFLDSQYIPIREAALGSLIYYYDYPAALAGAVKSLPPITDVGTKGMGYDLFIKDWKTRGEELKKWMEGKKPADKK